MPEIAVTVTRVAYPPSTATTDWYILVTDHGTAKGKMAWRPSDGEALILQGEYTTYQGQREFAFSSARLNVPVHPRDQLHYVATRTPGLGPSAETQLWETLGEAWQTAQPGAVPRLRGKTYENFKLQIESLSTKCEEMRVVAVLVGKGCTENMAGRAWATWKEETLGIVNSDPYRLADLENYGFRDVDGDIRRAYGIGDDDLRRIKAATLYALRLLTNAGDTLIEWDTLYQQATGLLHGYADEIAECVAGLFEDGSVKAFEGCGGVALAADWKAEKEIWDWVNGETEGKSE
jgi:exodeoxyribonuclease V alpha subunit